MDLDPETRPRDPLVLLRVGRQPQRGATRCGPRRRGRRGRRALDFAARHAPAAGPGYYNL